jgi:hypothetical protein
MKSAGTNTGGLGVRPIICGLSDDCSLILDALPLCSLTGVNY